MRRFIFALALSGAVFAHGCSSPAEDYVRAEAAAWAEYDAGDWLDHAVDLDPVFSPDKKDALHMLNKGRRARVRHALAAISSGS